MMQKSTILIGTGQRFQIQWQWAQPQEETFKLVDTQKNEILMSSTISDTEMYRVCEVMNELFHEPREREG